jgi:hypothetical protein
VPGVNRIEKWLLFVAVIALPAAAHSAFTPKDAACFASGAATYQIAPHATAPDFRIKIASEAPAPDLRMRLVDRPEIADFVLVDDFSAARPGSCRSSTPIRTVKLHDDTAPPDVTVRLSAAAGPADYTIYVHSARFSQHDAAALLAAMWKAERRREMAASAVR